MRALLVLAVLTVSVGAAAQPDWRPASDGPSFSADVLTAIGDDIEFTNIDAQGRPFAFGTIETTTSAFLLSGRVPVRGVTLVGEVPFGFVRYSYSTILRSSSIDLDLPDASDASLGNPYLGVAGRIGPVEVEGGVRVPLARPEPFVADARYADAAVVGPTLDPERFEAYASDLFSASLTVRAQQPLLPGLRVDARLSPIAFIEVGDAPDCRVCDTVTNVADAAIGYGLRLTADAGPMALHAGLAGRQFLTTERFDLFSVGATGVVGATLVRAPVRPGVLVRIPTTSGDYFGTDAVVGFSLEVPLR